MWVAKIKFYGDETLIGSRARKHDISVVGYPISVYRKGKDIYVHTVGFIFGEEKNKDNFIKDLKKSDRLMNIERKGDFVLAQIKDPVKFEAFYPPEIIHIEPTIIDNNGENIWTVGSWNRKALSKWIDFIVKNYKAQLLKLEERKITSFSVLKMRPELTDKQKKAMELAIKNGYYEVPRKTSVEKLAKISGLSFSTFQVHLRKAEQKLIPFYFS